MVKTVSTPAPKTVPNQILWGSITGTTQDYSQKSVTEFQLPALVGILPVRYAISRTTLRTRSDVVKAPRITAPFQAPGIALGDSAHYTLRRLRDGFLYVYCEKDNGWRIFEISEHGPLRFIESYNLPGTKGRDLLSTPTPEGMLYVHEDSPIWLGFSDVKWTRKLLDRHADAKIRAKHMRRFDPNPKAWQKEPHMAALGELSKRLAESATGISDSAFAFSGDPLRRLNPAQVLIRLNDDQEKNGAIVALDDPAGIAMDLANLMTTLFKEWTDQDDPDYKTRKSADPNAPLVKASRKTAWTMLSASGIEQLKAVAANRAEAKAYEPLRAHLSMDQTDMDEFLSTTVPYLNPEFTRPYRQKAQEGRDNAWKKYEEGDRPGSSAEMKKAEEQAYVPLRAHLSMDHMGMDEFISTIVPKLNPQVTAPYKKRALEARLKASGSSLYYDAKSYKTWKTAFDNRLKAFSDTLIHPLAEAHVAWCEHAKFRDYFNHVFDFEANDAGIGIAFTQAVALCYAGVQDKVPCWNHIEKWLKDDLRKPEDNLIVMALVLGHKETWTLVQEAALSKVDPRKIPWDKMVKALTKLTKDTEKGVTAVKKLAAEKGMEMAKDAATAQVAAEFSGPLASVIKESADTRILPAGAIAAGVASGKALIPVTIKGAISGHVKNLKFAIREAYPFLSPKEARSMAIQAIDGRYRDAYQQATPENRFIVHVDPELAKDIPQELSTNRKGLCGWLMAHGLSEAERYPRPVAPGIEPETVLGPEPAGEMAPLKVQKPEGPKESAWVKNMNKPESTIGMTCSVVSAVLAFVGWWQLNEEAKKKEGAAKISANNKLHFQVCAAFGATLETIGKAMATVMEKTAPAGSLAKTAIAWIKGGGAALGAIAGFAAAYYELKKMRDDDRLLNQGLLVAHLISGLIGVAGALLATTLLIWPSISSIAWVPIAGWILAAAGIIMLVVIEGLTDKIGDWLKQCSWGALGSDVRYSTLHDELSALKGAATT